MRPPGAPVKMASPETLGFLGHYNYWVAIALMMIGLYLVIARGNLVKKLVGLNIFQTAVLDRKSVV